MHILSTMYVELTNPVMFPMMVAAAEIRERLDFIKRVKNHAKWGSALQGGVVNISEKDFDYILSKSGLNQW